MRSRSSPSTSRALTSNVSVPVSAPTSTLATGFALRLRYHPGWSGAPPFDATTTYRSPSRWNITGEMRSSPLRAPTVVSSIRWSPNGPTPFPALEWNSWMVAALQSAITSSFLFYGCTANGVSNKVTHLVPLTSPADILASANTYLSASLFHMQVRSSYEVADLIERLVLKELPGRRGLDAWQALLRAHATLMRILDQDLEKKTGLSLAYYDVLAQLAEAAGELRLLAPPDRARISRAGHRARRWLGG